MVNANRNRKLQDAHFDISLLNLGAGIISTNIPTIVDKQPFGCSKKS